MVTIKDLLIIGLAVVIAAYLLTPHTPVSLPYLAPGQHSYEWRHAPGERIGARNHSGIEPYDLFGLRRSEQGRDYDGGRDLHDDRR
jgi:hypothetical protein